MENPEPRPRTDRIVKTTPPGSIQGTTDPYFPADTRPKFHIGDRVRWTYRSGDEPSARIEGVVRTITRMPPPEPIGPDPTPGSYRYQLTLDDGYQASAAFDEDTLEKIT